MSRPIHSLLAVATGVLLAAASLVAVGRGGSDRPSGVVRDVLALRDEVRLLEAFVERARGLRFREHVDVVALPDAEFLRLANFLDDEGRNEEREGGLVLQAIGLLEPGQSLTESYDAIIDNGVEGFYNPTSDDLIVRGTRVTPFLRRVLVHELAHALEDQHFDLDRADLGDEASLAFAALAEGSAIRVEEQWVETLSAGERAASVPSDRLLPELPPVPAAVEALFGFPYDFGFYMVEVITSAGGQRALDRAFTGAPPLSSENVLHPSRWLSGDRPVTVPVPTADGDVFDDGQIGAFTLQLMLERELPAGESPSASDRWGGDSYVAWHEGDLACVRATLVMDTPAAQSRLERALAKWAQRRTARVSGTSATADAGTLTTCA